MSAPVEKSRVCGECNHYLPWRGSDEFGSCRREEIGSPRAMKACDEIPSPTCIDYVPKGDPRACLPGRKHHSFRGRKTEGGELWKRPEKTCRWCGKTWGEVYRPKKVATVIMPV